MAPQKYSVAPPTEAQLDAFRRNLKRCASVEIAAHLAGIPRKQMFKWLELGRQEHPLFAPFTAIIDDSMASLQAMCMDVLTEEAFEKGNLKALMHLHKLRVEPFEKATTKRIIEITEIAEAERPLPVMSDEELDAIEQRITALKDASNPETQH